MKTIFYPAIALMNRLRYAQKFTLLGLLALVAIGSLQISLYGALDRVIGPSREELRGVEAIIRLNRVIQLFQQHRSLSAGLLGGRPELANQLLPKNEEVAGAFRILSAALPAVLAQTPRWRATVADWDAVRKDGLSWSLQTNLLRHDRLIASLLAMSVEIANATLLTLDPDFGSYYLIDTLLKLPSFTEQLGQTSANGAVVMSSKTVNSIEQREMAELLGRVQIARDLQKANLDNVMLYNPALREPLANLDRQFELDMRAAMEVVRKDLIGARFWIESSQYIAMFSSLTDKSYGMGDLILAPALRLHIEQRIADARKNLALNVALSALVGLAFAYLAFGMFLALSGQIGQVLQALSMLATDSTAQAELVETIAAGDLSREVPPSTPLDLAQLSRKHDEIGALVTAMHQMSVAQQALGRGFVRMTHTLRRHRAEERSADWFKSGMNALNVELRGDRGLDQMTQAVIRYLTLHVEGAVGALYLLDPQRDCLRLAAGHALTPAAAPRNAIVLGEGMAGAAARNQQTALLTVPPDYLPIASCLGQAAPAAVIAVPLLHDGKLMGLMELGSFGAFGAHHIAWLEQAGEAMAIAIEVEQARRRVDELLERTQLQTEELRVQQEQLQQSNAALEERAELLEQQREVIRQKSVESEAASRALQCKAEQLERTSAYKSEFLANMSHELRTPLNSMLILSSLLQQNKEGGLSAKQVEYAGTIHGAGTDLLNLINDILDLSKIEAGRLELQMEDIALSQIVETLQGLFQPVAEHHGIAFKIDTEPGAPAVLRADIQRTLQILKNLLANAFKFTTAGHVTLCLRSANEGEFPVAGPALAFAVSDSGIGIPAGKYEQIFHAFQQADGSTSRKYGGTGLGLSISRQLARNMGGDILLASVVGAGSTFTLYLPQDTKLASQRPPSVLMPAAPPERPLAAVVAPAQNVELPVMEVEDDRERLGSDQHSILIVEDDLGFACILRDTVRGHGFQALVAMDGEGGLALAEHYAPHAIILDVMLPHIDGWGVMRSIKDNPKTRHIPVHFITCLEDRQKALAMGAIGFVSKPVNAQQLDTVLGVIGQAIDKTVKKLLVVEDETQSSGVAALLVTGGIDIIVERSGGDALARLAQENFDCMVLDLGLPDMSGFDLLDTLRLRGDAPQMPVIVHSGQALSHADEVRLRRFAANIVIKGAKSPERLLGEVSLFLHLVESQLPQEKQNMIRRALDKEAMFEQRKVLLVDDDMRNIFALSSVLAEKGMQIVEASNGIEALEKLALHPDIDIVLMDIMMPDMDGFEAMRRIRQESRWARLPIIGLTAKAMVGDQKLCLEAGASDYLSKPVNLDKLFSLMRVWLYQGSEGR